MGALGEYMCVCVYICKKKQKNKLKILAMLKGEVIQELIRRLVLCSRSSCEEREVVSRDDVTGGTFIDRFFSLVQAISCCFPHQEACYVVFSRTVQCSLSLCHKGRET